MIRTRFAPSPTGLQQLGGFRTVLFDYLFAKQMGGQFILRIEDTDQARLVPGSVENLLECMKWLGLGPDEGVCADGERGDFGPYTQSKRLPIYAKHAEMLLKSGAAYRCFCTPERLEKLREEQAANHQAPRYDQHCRNLDPTESQARAQSGEPSVIRHAIPDGETVTLHDLIRGDIQFQSSDLDDYVLMKSDGFPTYQLANVVDDHLMQISHVLRGEEWIPSAPKNLLLYTAFGWTPPVFAHLPVILGPDGKKKLSKRDGAEPVLNYRDRGYLPEALINFLAFLGWSPGTEEEFFSLNELVQSFDLTKVQKAGAAMNPERLDYVNGWYIRRLPLETLKRAIVPYLVNSGLLRYGGDGVALTEVIEFPQKNLDEYLSDVCAATQERLKHFDEAPSLTEFFFRRPEVNKDLRSLIIPKKETAASTQKALDLAIKALEGMVETEWTHELIQLHLYALIERQGLKNGQLLWPIRAGLTGSPTSPGAFEMLTILGRNESLHRLQALLS